MADSSTVFSTSAVSGAYRSSQSIQPAPGLAEDAAQAPGQTFADMIRDAAGDAVQTMRESDVIAQSGMAGEASTQQVVEATIALESTVKIAVSMRDKLVEAYQEVMRMSI
ncbi:flagellar hook-basal body complex protein FliE [Albibacillus kandeliae]|uniref:flagellar hook-basal body complex protein FliE n=1 Tax=Albibacillus kandeliae TaxID=2174228 RepID=UPI000D68D779|nr:flagellar hook-basal body complex protein FliE [Albibacillus kandeliae]